MTEIIVTVGQMIASEELINKLIEKGVINYWVNYGLKKNSFGYIRLLHQMRQRNHVPLNIYLELPGSRCRHVEKKGEIKEDKTYILYDENAERTSEENYLVIQGLFNIMDDLA